ncbi:MAG: metallophosphoesterase [Candidatus Diapherotrites archaeon]|nr:metallophosphoesterase [Candidatus Diapherotrites archaeon]
MSFLELLAKEDFEKKILAFAGGKQLLLSPQALEILAERQDFQKILEELAAENVFMVREEDVKRKTVKTKISLVDEQTVSVQFSKFKPVAKDIQPNFRVFEETDVTNKSCSEGKVSDFLNLFRSKFEILGNVLKARPGFLPKPLNRLRSVANRGEAHFVAMVFRKWVTKNGHLAFEVEDLESKCIVLILKNDVPLTKFGETILPDNVIGVKASKLSDEMVIAKEIFWPDVPMRPEKRASRNVSLAAISDLHCGSKLFLDKPFSKFLLWINGNIGSEKDLEELGRIKYIVVTGDNVDGIGVYPDQINELAIKDIWQQYDDFCSKILEIPEYIEVFIIPGNHDAVRNADPMPALQHKLVKSIAGLKNIHLLGSPSMIEIEGLKTLLYHGGSVHDLYSSVSNLSYSKPEQALVELLKRRDLMPTYGLKHPYVPEKHDFMTLREVPDLFFAGDLHHNGYDSYHGTTVLNSGTFQGRTAFQVKQGHVPTPGIVPVIDLSTRKISEKRFAAEETG